MMLAFQLALFLALACVAAMVWRNHRDYPRAEPACFDDQAPLVSLLVPARNEAANIGDCLAGLMAQDYPRCEILVLDDGSTDGTGALARHALREHPSARILEGAPLPSGWAGKAHACAQLAAAARGEWLVFVDADTRQQPPLVSAAVAAAEQARCDLLSTFPRQETGSIGEALTVPFIYWVLFTMLPFWRVAGDPNPAFAAGCGQFLLIRRDAYETTGGHSAIRESLHDGLHLSRLFKRSGRRMALADLSGFIHCRMYRGGRECWEGFSRNAFQAIGSWPVLFGLMGLEFSLFLSPFLSLSAALVLGWPLWGWLAAGQVMLLFGIQCSLRGRFRYPWLTVWLHPLGIIALLAIQWRSGWRHFLGTSGTWKGRSLHAAPGKVLTGDHT